MHGTPSETDHPTAERTIRLRAVQDLLARSRCSPAGARRRPPGGASVAFGARDRGAGAVLRHECGGHGRCAHAGTASWR